MITHAVHKLSSLQKEEYPRNEGEVVVKSISIIFLHITLHIALTDYTNSYLIFRVQQLEEKGNDI